MPCNAQQRSRPQATDLVIPLAVFVVHVEVAAWFLRLLVLVDPFDHRPDKR